MYTGAPVLLPGSPMANDRLTSVDKRSGCVFAGGGGGKDGGRGTFGTTSSSSQRGGAGGAGSNFETLATEPLGCIHGGFATFAGGGSAGVQGKGNCSFGDACFGGVLGAAHLDASNGCVGLFFGGSGGSPMIPKAN